MYRTLSLSLASVLVTALAVLAPAASRAQDQFQFENDLLAKRRVFESVGPGFRAVRQGPDGNYYVLTAPAAAVQIYDSAGKRVGQIPSETAAKGTAPVSYTHLTLPTKRIV